MIANDKGKAGARRGGIWRGLGSGQLEEGPQQEKKNLKRETKKN